MKNNLQSNTLLLKMILLVTCFMLTILYNQSKAATKLPAAVSKVAVNFKHDVKKKQLKISLRSHSGATMKLFLFSPDGVLIQSVAVSTQKTTTISDVKKGLYFFECFDNDTRMKSGSLRLN